MIFLFIFLLTIHLSSEHSLCTSKIFCQGNLLQTVQMARIYPDSKTFVDLKLKNDEHTTLQKFETFMKNTHEKPSRRQIKKFIKENFQRYYEFDIWVPPDFTNKPKLITRIFNEEIRNFAEDLVNIWPKLARKMKKEILNSPHLTSLLPVSNGFIVPGGRFREFYYWDSYWVIEGLLLCEMYHTVRGMLDNFVEIVTSYGFVPNGSRIYYLNRTQPPLLTLMVAAYVKATNDTIWLSQNINILEKELKFFLHNRVTEVFKDQKKYHLAHYSSSDGTPRPESYYEDMKTASHLKNREERRELFADLKSAAESGWDFSSRWIVDPNGGINANLSFTQTRRIIPVDLNAILCQAFRLMSEFHILLSNYDKATFWLEKSDIWQKNIQEIFYDTEDGIWYDYDNISAKPRKLFYASNFAPLWTGSYDPAGAEEFGSRAAQYLTNQGILELEGGIPASLVESGEQWDYPNAWPPLQAMVIFGLDQTGNSRAQEIAYNLAQKYVESNLVSFLETNEIFEKYDVESLGQSGRGGEYDVQSGFGWTNGVLLQLIERYYTRTKRK